MSVFAYKVFLHAFCGKRQVQPHYEYEEDGDDFYCEVGRHIFAENSESFTPYTRHP